MVRHLSPVMLFNCIPLLYIVYRPFCNFLYNSLPACSTVQVTENQQGPDGVKPADAASAAQQTATQQAAAAAVPAAGAAPAAEPPEEEKFTVHVPEGLTYFDLDLIKMTAQFVARNGKGFLTGSHLFPAGMARMHAAISLLCMIFRKP